MSCDVCVFFFVKQKTAYEMRISDWSSDVCSSDLVARIGFGIAHRQRLLDQVGEGYAAVVAGEQPGQRARQHPADVGQDVAGVQQVAQGLDDWQASAHRSLVAELAAAVGGGADGLDRKSVV